MKLNDKADKGKFGGSCNRSHCQKPGADWYNFGSLSYYCSECAHELSYDSFNHKESMRLFGHLLCMKGQREDLEARGYGKYLTKE